MFGFIRPTKYSGGPFVNVTLVRASHTALAPFLSLAVKVKVNVHSVLPALLLVFCHPNEIDTIFQLGSIYLPFSMAEYRPEREKRSPCPVPANLPVFPYPGDNLPSRTVQSCAHFPLEGCGNLELA